MYFENKVSYKDHFELVSFRHRSFLKAHKTGCSYLNKHRHVLLQEARSFYYSRKKICEEAGYFIEDLLSYCNVWCVNLFGYWFKDALTKPQSEQEKILRFFLRQEFYRFSLLLFKKNKRTTMREYDEVIDEENLLDLSDKKFPKISHKTFLKRWKVVIKKKWVDREAKEFAIELLNLHQVDCEVCKRKSV
jgi:hypothetical protein